MQIYMHSKMKQRILLFMLFALVATLVFLPIASNARVPDIADFYNHVAAIIQAKIALSEGQFPLRIAPLEQLGWNYPFYQFYSSSSYTIAGFIYQWLTPNNPFLAYKITIWLSLVSGGIYMYRLAFWFVKSAPAATFSAITYLTTPYLIIVINHVAGFNEAIALGALPVVLYYSLQFYYFPAKQANFLFTALGWYLLATIHLVTFVYTSLCLGIFLVSMTCLNKTWKNLFAVSLAYFFGCILAMWYLAPIALYANYFPISNNFHYFQHQPLSYLLSPGAIITGESLLNLKIHPSLGLPISITVALCLYAFIKKAPLLHRDEYNWAPALLGLFFLIFIFVWAPFNLWQWLPPPLKIAQYNWRLLSQISWIGALLLAWASGWVFNNGLGTRYTLAGVCLLVLATSAWLLIAPVSKAYKITDIINKPLMIFNQGSYLIQPGSHISFISVIDSLSLTKLTQSGANYVTQLKFNTDFTVSRALLKMAAMPYVFIKGNIPEQANLKNLTLAAVINNKVISTKHLQPGSFEWKVILLPNLVLDEKAKSLNLHFDILNHTKTHTPQLNPTIHIDKIAIHGFLNPRLAMDAANVMQHCKRVKSDISCVVDVPKTTILLELPIFFYPDMLNITINGVPAAYCGVLYRDYLIAAVMPQAGKQNVIKIEFRGLLWANYLSATAWQLWLLFFIFIGLRMIFYRNPSSRKRMQSCAH